MQLKKLWDLQELDLSIASVKKDVEEAPLLSGFELKEEEIKQLREIIDEEREKLNATKKEMKQIELDIQKRIDDRNVVSNDLYGGKTTSVKELEQMQRRMDSLAEEKKMLEDRAIELMESIEELEVSLAEKIKQIEHEDSELDRIKKNLAEDLSKFKSHLEDMEAERIKLVESVDRKYLGKYEMLREKNQGRALALVENNMCTGCRVFISAALQGNLYNPDTMVYCENCGRMLYNPSNYGN